MVTGTCMPVVIFRSIWNAIIPHIPRGGTKVPKLAENSQSAVQSCVLGWGRGSAAAWLALPHTAWPVPACPAPLLAHTGAKAAQTPPAQGNSPSPDVQESTSMAVARVRCWECLVRGRDGLAEVWRGRDSWEPSGFWLSLAKGVTCPVSSSQSVFQSLLQWAVFSLARCHTEFVSRIWAWQELVLQGSGGEKRGGFGCSAESIHNCTYVAQEFTLSGLLSHSFPPAEVTFLPERIIFKSESDLGALHTAPVYSFIFIKEMISSFRFRL